MTPAWLLGRELIQDDFIFGLLSESFMQKMTHASIPNLGAVGTPQRLTSFLGEFQECNLLMALERQ